MKPMNDNDRIAKAIFVASGINADGTSAQFGSDYFTKCCEQRAGRSGKALGSTYDMSTGQLADLLPKLSWLPYKHANIQAPCVGFIAHHFGGTFGLLRVVDLAPDTLILLTDPKDTGFVEGSVPDLPQFKYPREKYDYTVAIVGPAPVIAQNSEATVETLYTFHPGPPIMPSRIATLDRHRLTVTKHRALELGLEWVKLS